MTANHELIGACFIGDLKLIQNSLDQGADINAFDGLAFLCAAHNGHLEVGKFLFENGVDIHKDNDEPLRRAAEHGHKQFVTFLVARGAHLPLKQVKHIRVFENDFQECLINMFNVGVIPRQELFYYAVINGLDTLVKKILEEADKKHSKFPKSLEIYHPHMINAGLELRYY